MKETKFSGAFAWLAVIMMVGVAFTGCVDSDDDDDDHQFHEGESSMFHKLILSKIIF